MKWQDIPSSKSLIKLIQQQLDLILPSVHGYSLVTLGELSANFDYQAADVANIIQICHCDQADVLADFHQLPLASDDIDAIFVPLQLEQSNLPHQLLREVVRSLRPGGKLILITFNPMSVWGLYKLVLGHRGIIPWSYPFFRQGRLTDWLTLLGLEVTVEHGLFAKIPGAEFVNQAEFRGSTVYSRFGAINFMVAEKKIKSLTTIRPSWYKSRVIAQRIFEPTRKHIISKNVTKK